MKFKDIIPSCIVRYFTRAETLNHYGSRIFTEENVLQELVEIRLRQSDSLLRREPTTALNKELEAKLNELLDNFDAEKTSNREVRLLFGGLLGMYASEIYNPKDERDSKLDDLAKKIHRGDYILYENRFHNI